MAGAAFKGRVEDGPLLTGAGRYTADHSAQTYAARFIRSPMAHAAIKSIDLSEALAMPDVVSVLAMADLDPLLPKLPEAIDTVVNRDGTKTPVPSRPVLARDRVRFVGEAVALVIARSANAAADAAEAVEISYEDLPAFCGLYADHRGEALHAEAPDNLGFDWVGGDMAAADLAFSRAAQSVSATIRVPRILGLPLEPVSAVASWDAKQERWTLVAPTQGSHAVRRELADGYLGVPHDKLRVITPDVGGAFGLRIHMLPEYAALLAAARLVGHPVAWVSDRTESNLCEPHARDFTVDAELALDGECRFLAVRASGLCNLGAYVHPGARATPTVSFLFGLQGAYRMPAIGLRMRGLFTNSTPTGPFRGAGQPEGTYVLERLIDVAAEEIGIPPAELRLRNVLTKADFPYRAATGHLIDSGDAAALLKQASCWLADKAAAANGKLSGAGLALYLKVNGMGRQEKAEIEVEADSGRIVARIGSQSNGQGHATTFGELVADRLGFDPSLVTVVQGDTDVVGFGTGTGASSALGTTGTGVIRSCVDLLCTARSAAAEYLGVEEAALDYESGGFRASGSNHFATLKELAAAMPDGLVGRSEVSVSLTYTFGCHACRVEVDPDTGVVQVREYQALDDLGPLLQPTIAEGQIHGGIAQGVGQALLETVGYDANSGQLLTATLLDYCLPRASDVPQFGSDLVETPCSGTDLGVRGAGEAGAIASMAAVVNAVVQAIGAGAKLDAPLTPHRVWQGLQAKQR